MLTRKTFSGKYSPSVQDLKVCQFVEVQSCVGNEMSLVFSFRESLLWFELRTALVSSDELQSAHVLVRK